MGGVTQVNTFTKMYLCSLGQYDYDAVPAIPPEIVLFRTGSTSTSTRSRRGRARSLCRSSIIYAKKPYKKIPENTASMSCLSAAAKTPTCACTWVARNRLLAQFLPGAGPHHALVRSRHIRPLRSIALQEGGEVDAGRAWR